MTCVERMLEYTELPQEPPRVADGGGQPPSGWPSSGRLAFERVSARYRPGLKPVLRGITFSLPAGASCGVVGRTGSGKSSLALTLLRLIEVTGGRVVLDGVDVASVGLDALRRQLAVIPQVSRCACRLRVVDQQGVAYACGPFAVLVFSARGRGKERAVPHGAVNWRRCACARVAQDPVLFSGTVRSNLDPWGHHTDAQLWNVLGTVQARRLPGRWAAGTQAPHHVVWPSPHPADPHPSARAHRADAPARGGHGRAGRAHGRGRRQPQRGAEAALLPGQV